MKGQKKGFKHSEETKKKISENSKKCWKNKEYIEKIRDRRIERKERLGYINSPETRKKLSKIMKKKIKNGEFNPKDISPYVKGHEKGRKGIKWDKEHIKLFKELRAMRKFPLKDTSIEIKVQNFLKQLGIEFYTHQYIKEIEHGYQCDIMIPIQEGITKKTIIECFGDYWHNYPYARTIDNQRCNELREKGWRVLCFWECEIKPMELNVLQ